MPAVLARGARGAVVVVVVVLGTMRAHCLRAGMMVAGGGRGVVVCCDGKVISPVCVCGSKAVTIQW